MFLNSEYLSELPDLRVSGLEGFFGGEVAVVDGALVLGDISVHDGDGFELLVRVVDGFEVNVMLFKVLRKLDSFFVDSNVLRIEGVAELLFKLLVLVALVQPVVCGTLGFGDEFLPLKLELNGVVELGMPLGALKREEEH